MKRLLILKAAYIFMITFTIIGGYYWYLYFDEREGKGLSDNLRLQLLNNGPVTYIDAIPNDEESNIPIYYFRVKNNISTPVEYTLMFNEISPVEANDGCDNSKFLKKSELSYQLTMDNKVIKSGKLSDINSVLDINKVSGNTTNDYSLKIFISPDSTDTLQKHYHYSVTLKEQNEKVS